VKHKFELRAIVVFTHFLSGLVKMIKKPSGSEFSLLKILNMFAHVRKLWNHFMQVLFKENLVIKSKQHSQNLINT